MTDEPTRIVSKSINSESACGSFSKLQDKRTLPMILRRQTTLGLSHILHLFQILVECSTTILVCSLFHLNPLAPSGTRILSWKYRKSKGRTLRTCFQKIGKIFCGNELIKKKYSTLTSRFARSVRLRILAVMQQLHIRQMSYCRKLATKTVPIQHNDTNMNTCKMHNT